MAHVRNSESIALAQVYSAIKSGTRFHAAPTLKANRRQECKEILTHAMAGLQDHTHFFCNSGHFKYRDLDKGCFRIAVRVLQSLPETSRACAARGDDSFHLQSEYVNAVHLFCQQDVASFLALVVARSPSHIGDVVAFTRRNDDTLRKLPIVLSLHATVLLLFPGSQPVGLRTAGNSLSASPNDETAQPTSSVSSTVPTESQASPNVSGDHIHSMDLRDRASLFDIQHEALLSHHCFQTLKGRTTVGTIDSSVVTGYIVHDGEPARDLEAFRMSVTLEYGVPYSNFNLKRGPHSCTSAATVPTAASTSSVPISITCITTPTSIYASSVSGSLSATATTTSSNTYVATSTSVATRLSTSINAVPISSTCTIPVPTTASLTSLASSVAIAPIMALTMAPTVCNTNSHLCATPVHATTSPLKANQSIVTPMQSSCIPASQASVTSLTMIDAVPRASPGAATQETNVMMLPSTTTVTEAIVAASQVPTGVMIDSFDEPVNQSQPPYVIAVSTVAANSTTATNVHHLTYGTVPRLLKLHPQLPALLPPPDTSPLPLQTGYYMCKKGYPNKAAKPPPAVPSQSSSVKQRSRRPNSHSRKQDCPSSIQCLTQGNITYIFALVRHNHVIDSSLLYDYPMHVAVEDFLKDQVALTPSLSVLWNALDAQQRIWETEAISNPNHFWKPQEWDPRFFPTKQTVKNFLKSCNQRFHQGDTDSQSVHSSIATWLKDHPADNIAFYPPTPEANNGVVLVVQTEQQREMLLRYGTRCFGLDATYKTNRYDFPLFFLVVQDNSRQAQLAGMFILSKEDHEHIGAALRQIREWNATWVPAFVVIDKSEAERKALPLVFRDVPGFQIILCNFHRLQAVLRWLNSKDNTPDMTKETRDSIYNAFQNLGVIWDVRHYNILKCHFLQSILAVYPSLVEYFNNNWFECESSWALCFRHADFNDMNTNNICEATNASVKRILELCVDNYVDTILKAYLTTISQQFERKWMHANMDSYREYLIWDRLPGAALRDPQYFLLTKVVRHNLTLVYARATQMLQEGVTPHFQTRDVYHVPKGSSTLQAIAASMGRQVSMESLEYRDTVYEVNVQQGTCECPGYVTGRNPCKHLLFIHLHLRIAWKALFSHLQIDLKFIKTANDSYGEALTSSGLSVAPTPGRSMNTSVQALIASICTDDHTDYDDGGFAEHPTTEERDDDAVNFSGTRMLCNNIYNVTHSLERLKGSEHEAEAYSLVKDVYAVLISHHMRMREFVDRVTPRMQDPVSTARAHTEVHWSRVAKLSLVRAGRQVRLPSLLSEATSATSAYRGSRPKRPRASKVLNFIKQRRHKAKSASKSRLPKPAAGQRPALVYAPLS